MFEGGEEEGTGPGRPFEPRLRISKGVDMRARSQSIERWEGETMMSDKEVVEVGRRGRETKEGRKDRASPPRSSSSSFPGSTSGTFLPPFLARAR